MAPYYFIPENAPEGFLAAVMSVCYLSPTERYERIELDLVNKGVPAGDILFDLLLSNGSRERRYFVVPFTGKKFRMNGTRMVPRTPELEAWSKAAFSTYPFMLSTSVLRSPELHALV